MAFDRALDAVPRLLEGILRQGEREAAVLGFTTSAAATGWSETRSTEAASRKASGSAHAVERADSRDVGKFQRDRARLVEDDRAGAAESLDHAAALHDHPRSAPAPETPERSANRGCEDERARRRDDEHGEGADGVARGRHAIPATAAVNGRKNTA